ncbi:MAG TPA: STAS domain-containing protein [Anaerolineales bacterium]
MDFKLSKEQPQGRPNVTVVRLGGWLDAQSEKQLVDAVQQAKNEGAEYVLLDLREVDTITSAGIRAIQRAFQILTPREEAGKVVRLKLCNAPAPVYQVLSVTGLLINVPMYESAEDAIASFGA